MLHKMAMQWFPTFFSFIVADEPARQPKETVVLPEVSNDPEEAFWEVQRMITPAE